LRFGAASRDEAQAKRVPRHSCEAATAGWSEVSPELAAGNLRKYIALSVYRVMRSVAVAQLREQRRG
jgi:hypothetical protein